MTIKHKRGDIQKQKLRTKACEEEKRQNKALINKAADPVGEFTPKRVEFAFQIFLLSADLTAASSTRVKDKHNHHTNAPGYANASPSAVRNHHYIP